MVLRSLDNARRIDVGFEPHNQLMAAVDLGLQGYDEAAGRNFFRTLKERVAALPGVEAVGYAEVVPLAMANQHNSAVPSGHEIPVVASWVPARRASQVDPMTVLRAE